MNRKSIHHDDTKMIRHSSSSRSANLGLGLLLASSVFWIGLPSCQGDSKADNSGGQGGSGAEHSSGGQGGSGAEAGSPAYAGSNNSSVEDPCCELGALCHVEGGADDSEIDECHVIGHRNDRATCQANYDRCMAACASATDHPKPHACH